MLMGQPAQADDHRLAADAAARLSAAGFATRIRPDVPSDWVIARRGDCRLYLWNGDRGGEVRSAYVAQAQGIGALRFGHLGLWSPDPPGFWPNLARYAANRLASAGLVLSRPATLALAAAPVCPATLPTLLDGLRIWPIAR